MLRTGLASAAAALVIAAPGCARERPSAAVGLDIAPCEHGYDGYEADCGQLRVYENRETRSGRVIPINFIRVRAKDGASGEDALFALTGGPGENASASAQRVIATSRSLASRDLVILDQRGTGKSNPLDCVRYDLEARPEAFAEMFEKSFFDADRFRTCKDELSGIADLTQYTTSIIADDIDDLREALGYKTMTLAGASYGTTLALETIRRHGAHVRAAVLTGATPPWVNQTETIASDTETMLEALFLACEADSACNGAYPSFRNDFHDVLERVR
ncbi:MAG: alpha/beta hydrolase, partial [Parvularculaceae bacterium]